MAETFIPCDKCNSGYIYDEKTDSAVKCECLKEFQRKRKLEITLNKASIPYDYIKDYHMRKYIGRKSIDNLQKLKQYVDKFEEKFFDKHIYFYGAMGTQKTTVAYWVGRELIKKGLSVKYVLMDQLIKDLQKQGWEDEVDISQYSSVDCLIIDRAFMADQVTLYKSGYQIPFLDNFLRQRMDQEQKSTIFISNNEIDNIASNGFGKDIEDLVRRKIKPFNSLFYFLDHYTQKDDFDTIDLWED